MTRLHGSALSILLALALPAACLAQQGAGASSRAYRGHAGEHDLATFVSVYRRAIGSRLDDCQTCHRGGAFTEAASGRTVTKNPCDYCHLTRHPVAGYAEPLPASFRATLNAYGLAYLERGRSESALRAIARLDSDGDGAPNGVEIAALRYPGDAASRPGQPSAPTRIFTMAQIRALPSHTEFVLVNATRQPVDYYASYRGVTIRDLLLAAGVDPGAAGFQGVTVVAPDGYLHDVTAREINSPFSRGTFYGGLDAATLGAACGFVQYPPVLPSGVTDRAPIPGEPWLLLAYEREGQPLDVATLDVTSGRIGGEGPFRLVVPQSPPGAPDRGSAAPAVTCPDGHPFDAGADHNGGAMVRGVIAVRVNPVPAGHEDFDARNGGWAFVENASVVVYGFGVRPR
ncbi:MAG: GEGP motif-containing diheme protein [Gemmatimonadales bacterium]|jgi:hypothetical protein